MRYIGAMTDSVPDPIRAADTSDTGELGEASAAQAFAVLRWPAAPTTRAQDLGMDLIVAARDRRFHRGEWLGVQVKAGPSNLDAPVTDDNGVQTGWWVTVKPKHVEYWIASAIPHILVLYDDVTNTCHWQHLSTDRVQSTGEGYKVCIPVGRVLAPGAEDELLAVIATARAPVPLEGTAWTGGAPSAPSDRLRYALIAPRLMAPHPNSSAGPADPAEACALLMQARPDDVWPWGPPHEGVPSQTEAKGHASWGWRFVAALEAWIVHEEDHGFEELRVTAGTSYERVAVTAVIAHRHLAAGEPDQASALLVQEIDRDTAAPVDNAWLHLHLARARLELADLDGARRAATVSLAIGATQRHDVTATAIRGVAAAVLLDVSPFGDADFADTIRDMDTAVVWWRSQTAHRGLAAAVTVAFDRAVGYEPSDHEAARAHNETFAASIQSGVLGSQGQWCRYSELLARQDLLETPDADAKGLAGILVALRRGGAEKATSRATRWIGLNGSGDAVAIAANGIDLDRSTSSSIVADLTLLREAGDITDEGTAVAAADWLEDAMRDSTRLEALTHRMAYDPQQWIARQMTGILAATPLDAGERVARIIEAHGPTFQSLAQQDWGRAISAVPHWTAGQVTRISDACAAATEDQLAFAIARIRQPFDQAAVEALLDLVRSGRFSVLGHIDQLGSLPTKDVDDLRTMLHKGIRDDCDAERRQRLARGAERALDGLVAFALVHPDEASWGVVAQTLANDVMPAWYKANAVARLAVSADELDNALRSELAQAVRAAAAAPPSQRWGGGDDDIAPGARYAAVALDSAGMDVAEQIARLAAGNGRDRQWGARLAADAADFATLAVLAADRAPHVRAAAARGLALAAADGGADQRVLTTLERVVGDRGTATGLAVAGPVSAAPEADDLGRIRARLDDHPSAQVRRLVRSESAG